MARVVITQENMDKSKIVAPGKYLCLVSDYVEDSAAKDGSALYVYTLKVIDGKDTGVEFRHQVSEKAEGMGYAFWEACGFVIKPGAQLDPASFKGKKVGVHIQRGEYKGRPQNQPVDFFAVESVSESVVV